MPQNPTRITQLPLSGRDTQSGEVTVTQRTVTTGGPASAVSVDSMVTVLPPYNGSAAAGKDTAGVISLTLADALRVAFKQNLGAFSQSAMEEQARGQQGIAKSELLPQLNTVISEVYEKENLRTVGLKTPSIPSITTFNYFDARAVRNDVVQHISGASWLLRRTIQGLTQRFAAHAGSPGHSATLRAFSVTNTVVNGQAQIYAYVDVLRYFGFPCLVCVPFAFLLQRPPKEAQGAA